MLRVSLTIAMLAMSPCLVAASTEAAPGTARAVLVTGASSGIGRKVTERLAADGWFVYACARKEADLRALAAIPNVQAIPLDVTKPAEIDAAVEAVGKAGRGLYGLVNNAGIYTGGMLLDAVPAEFDLVMQVNVYGPYRVTRAFLPMIRAARGRIVNIGSISGVLNYPGDGVYQMSKHAIETFSATLAQELASDGVLVSTIEPGAYKSEILRTAAQRSGTVTQQDLDESAKRPEPDDVAAAVEMALSEARPKARYMVVPSEDQARMTIEAQIAQLVELNEGQRYTFDRAELIRILDAALEKARPRTAGQQSHPERTP